MRRISKVLLLAPPAFTFKNNRDINPLPPMGLGYLASVIERMGLEVDILDCLILGWEKELPVDEVLIRVGPTDAEIADYIARFKPDLVGVSCLFSRQNKIYHHMFDLIKAVDRNITVLAGGAHATVCAQELLTNPNCDFVMAGEAEDSLKDFIQRVNKGENISTVDGLCWRDGETFVIRDKRDLINDLDGIHFPAYHLMRLEQYFGLKSSHGLRHKNRFSPIISSRGCPAKCTFCSAHKVWGKFYRLRSVDNVLSEMHFLKDKFGVEEIMFEDDNLTADAQRTHDLFTRMIDEKLNFVWDTPNGTGIWPLEEPILDLMQASGCINLNFPVESGNQRVLNYVIGKPLKLDKVVRLTKYCRTIGLNYGMFLVVGMPGERISEMWDSVHFAAECRAYSPHISVATPYPGTRLYETCVKNGYFARPFSLDDLFIRGYLIKTPEWDDNDLRVFLEKANLYLKFKHAVDEPMYGLNLLRRKIMHPNEVTSFISRIRSQPKNISRHP
jgi:anaerobic magnesium-protoporphyrin IX monomethyl ester cyclase